MNIIFFSRREGRARHFNLGHPLAVAGFATVLVAILAVLSLQWLGYSIEQRRLERAEMVAGGLRADDRWFRLE